MEPDQPVFARLTLDGERFNNAHLPVDALEELQRFQAIVLEAAKRAWRLDNPGADPPADFESSFNLTLTQVLPGSATSILERTGSNAYDQYFEQGRNEFEAELETLLSVRNDADEDYSYEEIVDVVPLIELRAFRDFGSSLRGNDELVLRVESLPDSGVDYEEIVVRPADRQQLIAQRVDTYLAGPIPEPITPPQRRTIVGEIAGRLTMLDANNSTFVFQSLVHGRLTGKFKDPDIVEDLTAVLNSSAKAPVVRVKAEIRLLGELVEKIRDVQSVELMDIDGQPWSRRIIELASIESGWGEEEDGKLISFASLDAAKELMAASSEVNLPVPGIYPLELGGVQLQWASANHVTTIEISPDLEFTLFSLEVASRQYSEQVVTNLDEAKQFAQQVTV